MGFVARGSFWAPVVTVTLAAFGLGFLVADGQAKLYELKAREERLLSEFRSLVQERDKLLDERRRLLTEPAAIERVAREQYGFAAPGEVPIPYERPSAGALSPVRPAVPESALDRIVGRGDYPWILPAGAFVLSMVVLASLEGITVLHERRAPRG